jgi:hypothetical protein
VEQVLALGVHVGGGDVSDLAGGPAQPHPLVVDGQPDPDRTAVGIALVQVPEVDVVPVPRAVADRLLEGQFLLAAVVIQTANRRAVVRPLEDRRVGHLQAAFQG